MANRRMASLAPIYDMEEFARRGDEVYARAVLPHLSPDDRGKYVVLDIETDAYEIDDDESAAADRLHSRMRDAQVWLVRVGWPYARRFGARGTEAASQSK